MEHTTNQLPLIFGTTQFLNKDLAQIFSQLHISCSDYLMQPPTFNCSSKALCGPDLGLKLLIELAASLKAWSILDAAAMEAAYIEPGIEKVRLL